MSRDKNTTKVQDPALSIERLHELALKNISDVLDGTREIDDTANLAMKLLNYESRQTAIEYGRTRLAFSMVKTLADPELVRKYVISTEPLVKRLIA
jgi:hypothetical protein